MGETAIVTDISKVSRYCCSSLNAMFRISEMGAGILNSKVAPVAENVLAAINLGEKAFKFTKIELGDVKPVITNIR